MTTQHVVAHDNWVDSVNDQISQGFWNLVGGFVWCGVLVTGVGAFSGYVSTPQGQEVAPLMVEHAVAANVNTWKAAGTLLKGIGQVPLRFLRLYTIHCWCD